MRVDLDISTELTDTLNLQCDGYRVCRYFTLDVHGSGAVNVDCNGQQCTCCIISFLTSFVVQTLPFSVSATSSSACRQASFDASEAHSLTWNCSAGYSLSGQLTEVWCPSGKADSCHIVTNGTGTVDSVQIYVDESYTSDYLRLECLDEEGCDIVDVNCDGEKGIAQEQMVSDGVGSYYCDNGGASYCCPTINCTELNDEDFSFDTDLIDIDLYLEDVGDNAQIEIANDTVHSLEGTLLCTAEICVVRCLALLSCAFATVSVESNEVIIECYGQYSCLSLDVVATDSDISNQTITILCLGMF